MESLLKVGGVLRGRGSSCGIDCTARPFPIRSRRVGKELARLKEEQQRFPQVFAPSALDISAPTTSTLVAEVEQLQTGCTIAGTERGVDVFFEAASGQSRCERPFRAVAGRVFANVRRRSCTMDSKRPSRCAEHNVGGERTRVGTVVPRGGQCSGRVVQEFPLFVSKFDQMTRLSKGGLCSAGFQVRKGMKKARSALLWIPTWICGLDNRSYAICPGSGRQRVLEWHARLFELLEHC